MAKLFVNNGLHAEQVHKRVDFVVDIRSLHSSNAGEHPKNLATSHVVKHRVELRTVADLLVYLECDVSDIKSCTASHTWLQICLICEQYSYNTIKTSLLRPKDNVETQKMCEVCIP